MPRKRTTRVKAANIPKPTGTNSKKMTQIQRQEQEDRLQLLLKEIDSRAHSHLKDFEKSKRTMTMFIRRVFNENILPPEIASMTVREFAEAGGTIEEAQDFLTKKQEFKPPVTKLAVVEELQNLLCNDRPKQLESVIEEEDGPPVKQTPALNAKRAKTVKKVKSTMPPPSATRTSKRIGATPLNTVSRKYWTATPLITPKFDPNLPHTPENIREPKPGECFMSLDGSPLHIQADKRRRAINTEPPTEQVRSVLQELNITPRKMTKVMESLCTIYTNQR